MKKKKYFLIAEIIDFHWTDVFFFFFFLEQYVSRAFIAKQKS